MAEEVHCFVGDEDAGLDPEEFFQGLPKSLTVQFLVILENLVGQDDLGPGGDDVAALEVALGSAELAQVRDGLEDFLAGDEVLVAAPSPKEVVAWLARHGQRAQSMFRVPDSEQAIIGAAPQ